MELIWSNLWWNYPSQTGIDPTKAKICTQPMGPWASISRQPAINDGTLVSTVEVSDVLPFCQESYLASKEDEQMMLDDYRVWRC